MGNTEIEANDAGKELQLSRTERNQVAAMAPPRDVVIRPTNGQKAPLPERRVPAPIPPQVLGLKTRYQPNDDEEILYDIVAVHGIGVNPVDTWTHRKTNTNWLSNKNMLPSRAQNARIMTFNYNSTWFGDKAIHQTLTAVSTKLLESLCRHRAECASRPIIFIGHCFGGLVIQEAFTSACLHSRWKNVADAFAGAVFLGTPHQGLADTSGLTTQGEIYQHLLNNFPTEPSLMQTVYRDNETLVEAVHRFTQKVKEYQPAPKLYCFFEQAVADVFLIINEKGRKKGFVVNEASGSLSGYGKEGLPLDHFAINKFECPDDDNFQSVCAQIMEIQKHAKSMIEERELEKAPPIARESNFAHRGGIISRIEEGFKRNPEVVLCGVAGTGKTHVAVEYAHRYKKTSPDKENRVFWVYASTAEDFEASYKRIADSLRLTRDTKNTKDVLEAVSKYLKTDDSGSWLMVIDGADSTDKLLCTDELLKNVPLLKFIPTGDHAKVLVTTQSLELAKSVVGGKRERIMMLDALGYEDASVLLLNRTPKSTKNIDWVKCVSQELGGSAAALSLALIYSKSMGKNMSQAKYVEMLKSRAKQVSGVDRAWSILHQLISEHHPDIRYFMYMICSISAQCIPRCFFTRRQLETDIPLLVEYGVVEPSQGDRFFSVTSSLRSGIQNWLKEQNLSDPSILDAVSTMSERFDKGTGDALLPCALTLCTAKPSTDSGKRALATLLFKIGRHLMDRGQNQRASHHLETCLSMRQSDNKAAEDEYQARILEVKEALKTSKAATLAITGSLEAPSRTPMTIQKLKSTLEKVLAASNQLKELEVADKHWHSVNTVAKANEVANLQMEHKYRDGSRTGKNNEDESRDMNDAIGLLKRVHGWCRANHGDHHLDTAKSQYNLALAFESEGDYRQAEQLHKSALKIIEPEIKCQAPSHDAQLTYLRVQGSLASNYCQQGRLDEAEDAFSRVVPGLKHLGLDHPIALSIRHDIASLWQEQGDLETSAEEFRSVHLAQANLLGEDNPETLQTACSIALNLRLKGQIDGSEEIFTHVWKTQASMLGDTHCHTRRTKVMLEELRSLRSL